MNVSCPLCWNGAFLSGAWLTDDHLIRAHGSNDAIHNRLRELEAELAKWTNVFGQPNKGATPQDWHDEMMETEARAEKAEARVARLINRLEQWKDPYTGEESREREEPK